MYPGLVGVFTESATGNFTSRIIFCGSITLLLNAYFSMSFEEIVTVSTPPSGLTFVNIPPFISD